VVEQSPSAAAESESIYPWAESNLQPLATTPEPTNEVTLFWHIPKSGGTNAKAIYECLGLKLASRAGALPRFGHDQDEELVAFQPWKPKGNDAWYVNVDTTSSKGILHAEDLGLVPSHVADLIFTSAPSFAIEHLYDDSHRGRALGLFRHPIERLVSKFYYLQVAKWERTYSPGWKKLTVEEWATSKNIDNDHMVKTLARKRLRQQAMEEDLQIAMDTIRERFVVGLTDEMEESIHRFNVVLGIDEAEKGHAKCMDRFFGKGMEKKNSNSHPTIKEGDKGWQVLAEKNAMDIRLYDYILQLFEEQREIIDSYTNSMVAVKE
jgi:hypothetical protein